MDRMAAAIQFAIGLVFALYGVFTLLRAKRRPKGNALLALACVFVGIFLMGYAAFQVI